MKAQKKKGSALQELVLGSGQIQGRGQICVLFIYEKELHKSSWVQNLSPENFIVK